MPVDYPRHLRPVLNLANILAPAYPKVRLHLDKALAMAKAFATGDYPELLSHYGSRNPLESRVAFELMEELDAQKDDKEKAAKDRPETERVVPRWLNYGPDDDSIQTANPV